LIQDIPGVWNQIIDSDKVQNVDHMHVYDAGSSGSNGITFNDPNAVVVENSTIQKALLENMPGTVDVEFDCEISSIKVPVEYESAKIDTDLVELDDLFKTSLLIGADGANSQVKKAANMRTDFEHDYLTRATCAQLITDEVDVNVAWQRFLPSGPIALLPLTNGHFNLIWSADNEMAKRLSQLSDDAFLAEINYVLNMKTAYEPEIMKHLPHLPSSTNSVKPLRPPQIVGLAGKRASFPIHAVAGQVVAPRVGLIGDAAHRVHPLAGQGLNMGLRDVKNIESCIKNGWYRGADIGVDDGVLRKYNYLQNLENVPIGAGLHLIDGVMKNSFQPVVAARNIGMSVVDNVPALKNFFSGLAKR
jgi:ubiquinone biosynthesis monooxygenase Coq6